ncbi:phosphatidylinositol 4-kinase type 2-beta-like [Artemia franciscana]|uniref:phosphatidylinositol 4-kinase type 2-beta-like n=1 Tax=Artemia franciscana TaxID=6661 RepID=UPI0032D9B01E
MQAIYGIKKLIGIKILFKKNGNLKSQDKKEGLQRDLSPVDNQAGDIEDDESSASGISKSIETKLIHKSTPEVKQIFELQEAKDTKMHDDSNSQDKKVGLQRLFSAVDISSDIEDDVSSISSSIESVEAESMNKSTQEEKYIFELKDVLEKTSCQPMSDSFLFTYGYFSTPMPYSLANTEDCFSTSMSGALALRADCSFAELAQKAKDAIRRGIRPIKVPERSSGRYFLRDEQKKYIAVFKPKDEEPCPYFFGRKCLLRNQGYLSEAGAYLVDQKLKLGIVPETRVEAFACKRFHYSKVTKIKLAAKKAANSMIHNNSEDTHKFIFLPGKVGSMQLFIEGCKNAKHWLGKPEFTTLDDPVKQQFQEQFERLVILDYIIRNTDRTLESWLIRCEKEELQKNDEVYLNNFRIVKVEIFAIDNGLAFPFRDPDSLGGYHFQWAELPYAKKPFTQATIDAILPLVSKESFIQELRQDILDLFKLDKNFNIILYEKQMRVLRGQILNVQEALSKGKTPEELAEMRHLEKRKRSGHVESVNTEPRHF